MCDVRRNSTLSRQFVSRYKIEKKLYENYIDYVYIKIEIASCSLLLISTYILTFIQVGSTSS